MKYVLGIDTTFHSSGVALIDEEGQVLSNTKIDIDFDNENARKFFNFHNQNVLSLTKPLLDKYGNDIFLISASSEDGPFHSMPVGAIVANSLSYFLHKKIVGVDHHIAHIHASWLDRKEGDFSFPIVCLSISGANSSVYLVKNILEVEKISDIIWRDDSHEFRGLGVLFAVICHNIDNKVKKGKGGLRFENLASMGDPIFKEELQNFVFIKKGKNILINNVVPNLTDALRKLGYHSLSGEALEKFRKNFAASLSEILFDSLVGAVIQIAKEVGAREIHLTGGVALDKNLSSKLFTRCEKSNFNFKTPIKPEYCRDNAAMTAISGYFKWKYSDFNLDKKFLTIKPSEWYFRYYAKYFSD